MASPAGRNWGALLASLVGEHRHCAKGVLKHYLFIVFINTHSTRFLVNEHITTQPDTSAGRNPGRGTPTHLLTELSQTELLKGKNQLLFSLIFSFPLLPVCARHQWQWQWRRGGETVKGWSNTCSLFTFPCRFVRCSFNSLRKISKARHVFH